jgi:hypothetical protein
MTSSHASSNDSVSDTLSFITGKTFFPNLMSVPFMEGLKLAFTFSLVLNLISAAASWLCGPKS